MAVRLCRILPARRGSPYGNAWRSPGEPGATVTIPAEILAPLRARPSLGLDAALPAPSAGSARGRDPAEDARFRVSCLVLCHGAQQHMVGVCQEAKGYVPVLAVPPAYLVFIQA